MCTAIALRNENGFYFGRNMDLYYRLDFEIIKTPTDVPIRFTNGKTANPHNGILGSAVVVNGQPLYADGMNSVGLCVAGLDFPGYAYYFKDAISGKKCIAPYELIPWVLSQCSTVEQARMLLSETVLIDRSFDSEHPLTPMHWMIADQEKSLIAEPTKDGLKLYDAPSNVLTNSPEYPFHAANLRQFAALSPKQPHPHLNAPGICEPPFSYGFGAIGLPGDWSSASRFVRAAFVTAHSKCDCNDRSSVSHFFRLLSAVGMPMGAIKVDENSFDRTLYSCCMDTQNKTYNFLPYDFINHPLKTVRF